MPRSQPFFQRVFSIVCLMGCFAWGWVTPAIAAPSAIDLSRQPTIEIKVHLGNASNELKFVPDTIEFAAGKRYKLVLDNPSNNKHYFTAKDFADNIWSQKVEAGNVEIKGAIHELELKPGAVADWVFVPVKAGTYELHCSIPGHAEAGMIGKLAIAPAKAT
ncbi:MAG: cupredoxin domain-containing protein [Oscillatoriales cyanobacterium C42_A2020_001]|nr:cupredoxin domain-containing protein [Leptolyngbyaceae cyanobacterium C42_A2020_001]